VCDASLRELLRFRLPFAPAAVAAVEERAAAFVRAGWTGHERRPARWNGPVACFWEEVLL
jgi:hypothetical protein